MKPKKTVYYADERQDDFAGNHIQAKPVDEHFPYTNRRPLWHAVGAFLYRAVATPVAFAVCRGAFGMRVKNRRALRRLSNTGFFMYANHTQALHDAFSPSLLSFPKKCYIITSPDSVSLPFLRNVVLMLGAIPLPTTAGAVRKFKHTVEKRIRSGKPVMIYPEAHIWPYYTGIRPFTDVSFHYPVQLETPVFCFTNTYQKRRWSKRPRTVTYVDGPFFPDGSLPAKARKKDLRDRVYRCMCERAKNSDVVYIEYRKKEEEHG